MCVERAIAGWILQQPELPVYAQSKMKASVAICVKPAMLAIARQQKIAPHSAECHGTHAAAEQSLLSKLAFGMAGRQAQRQQPSYRPPSLLPGSSRSRR